MFCLLRVPLYVLATKLIHLAQPFLSKLCRKQAQHFGSSHLVVSGVVKTICKVLHILLNYLRNIFNPLVGGLGGVGEGFPAPVHLGQRSLKRGWSPRSFSAPGLISFRRKFLYFRSTVS